MITPEWIAADLGGTGLRVWAIGGADEVLAEASAPCPADPCDLSDCAELLAMLTAPWRAANSTAPVLLSGCDAGQGARPVVPCAPTDASTAQTVQTHGMSLRLLPFVTQTSPIDMLGSATIRVAGFLAQNPDFEGIFCLPGAQTRWVHLSAGEIVSFRSFLSGEMVGALTQARSLRALQSETKAPLENDSLLQAVRDGMAKPALLAARLAGIGAELRLNDTPEAKLHAQLYGLMIGAELSAARAYWLGQDVVVANDAEQMAAPLAPVYLAALQDQAAMARAIPGADLALRGLCAAYAAAS